MVHFFCVDECHYITNAGRYFCPEFFINIRFIVGRLWNQCPMLFLLASMNRVSMYHTSLMLHPESSMKTMGVFSLDLGLDDCSIHIPTIDLLPSKVFTALMWGKVARPGVDFIVDFTSSWLTALSVPLIEYTRHGCKAMGYYSSAVDARDTVKLAIQKLLREASVDGDTVVLTGSDGIMIKTWLIDLFVDKTTSLNCKIMVVIGTSTINCGISSPSLYYIFMKGFPRNICLIQLMGRLKCGSGERIKQDRILLILSLPYFVSIYFSILSLSNKSEKD